MIELFQIINQQSNWIILLSVSMICKVFILEDLINIKYILWIHDFSCFASVNEVLDNTHDYGLLNFIIFELKLQNLIKRVSWQRVNDDEIILDEHIC